MSISMSQEQAPDFATVTQAFISTVLSARVGSAPEELARIKIWMNIFFKVWFLKSFTPSFSIYFIYNRFIQKKINLIVVTVVTNFCHTHRNSAFIFAQFR